VTPIEKESAPGLLRQGGVQCKNRSSDDHKKEVIMNDESKKKPAGLREIKVTAEASSLEKWRKQVVAGQPETGRSYAFISDEGSYMPGGEGTAPTPLTYFVSGMAL
jgi:hypothetical protein